MAIDYKAIAEFAIDNPEMWEILSAGYDDDATDAISNAITAVEKERSHAVVTKALGLSEFDIDVENFENNLHLAIDYLLELAPLQERDYKGSVRHESRFTLSPFHHGLNVDLRVWRRFEEDETSD